MKTKNKKFKFLMITTLLLRAEKREGKKKALINGLNQEKCLARRWKTNFPQHTIWITKFKTTRTS